MGKESFWLVLLGILCLVIVGLGFLVSRKIVINDSETIKNEDFLWIMSRNLKLLLVSFRRGINYLTTTNLFLPFLMIAV